MLGPTRLSSEFHPPASLFSDMPGMPRIPGLRRIQRIHGYPRPHETKASNAIH